MFAERPDVELCAVVGSTPERAAARAREFGINPYADLDEMLERERPDLVSIRHHRLVRDGNPGRRPRGR